MVKILIYAPSVGRGGVHRVIEKLTHELAAQILPAEHPESTPGLRRDFTNDWEFHILGQRFDEIGQQVKWPIQWPFTQIDPVNKLPLHPNQFPFLRAHQSDFYQHLKRVEADYDLIFCPTPWWAMNNNEFKLTRPFVTVINDFAFDHIDVGAIAVDFHYTARYIGQHSTLAIFTADYHRRWGTTFYGFNHSQVIHHSADFIPEVFVTTEAEGRRVRKKYNLPDQYVLAFHCAYHKDPISILLGHRRAMNNEAVPPLVMGGIGTQYYLNNQQNDDHVVKVKEALQVIQPQIGKDLFIVGQIPEADIAGLYMGAVCAITASTSEGDLSGTIFEAMFAHAPLIYSDLAVFTERLGMDKQYGLCFRVGDFAGLGEAIQEVCAKPEEAKKRAENAYAFATARTVKDVAGEYIEAFKGVLAL